MRRSSFRFAVLLPLALVALAACSPALNWRAGTGSFAPVLGAGLLIVASTMRAALAWMLVEVASCQRASSSKPLREVSPTDLKEPSGWPVISSSFWMR